jgi:hypothetical protein
VRQHDDRSPAKRPLCPRTMNYELNGKPVTLLRTFKRDNRKWVKVRYEDGSERDVLYRSLDRVNDELDTPELTSPEIDQNFADFAGVTNQSQIKTPKTSKVTIHLDKVKHRFEVTYETARQLVEWLTEAEREERASLPEGYIPSPAEVLAASTEGKGNGFTRKTLELWGVGWPAPRGWRRDLRRRWEAARRNQNQSGS